MHCDLILASLWHGGKVGNGQATGSRIPPCRRTAAVVAVLRGLQPVLEMNRIASPHRSKLSFLYNRAQFLPGLAGNRGLQVWFQSGSRYDWQPCDQDSGQVHSRSPRAVAGAERPTSCLPACRPATLLRFLAAAWASPSVRQLPVSVPGERARSRAGPYNPRPELRETTSTTGGINLDVQYFSKVRASRKTEFSLS